jgi:hypothetical protein
MTISDSTLLVMVRQHLAKLDDERDYETLALAVLPGARPEDRRGAETLLAADPELAEAEALARELEAKAPSIPMTPPARFSRPALAIAAGLVVAMLAAGLSSSMFDRRPLIARGSTAEGAAHDVLTVRVKRGEALLPTGDAGRLEAGDHVGFFYSTDRPGYLMILHRDRTRVVLLDPAGSTRSRPIDPAGNPRLGGAEITPGEGCEWFVGVFSDDVLDAEHVRAAVERGASEPDVCELRVDVAGARSVEIHSYRVMPRSR